MNDYKVTIYLHENRLISVVVKAFNEFEARNKVEDMLSYASVKTDSWEIRVHE